MFAVIFEVQPKPQRFDDYLNVAKTLKPALERIDGFIDNERFASRRTAGRILSLSTWRDEKAVIRWRTLGLHHDAQAAGRNEIFADYHLRVGEVVADSRPPPGETLLEQRLDATETGATEAVTISEYSPAAGEPPAGAPLGDLLGLPAPGISGVVDREWFESIAAPGKLLLLAGWRDPAAAARWRPSPVASGTLRHRQVRIVRDYGMSDRREAPQYFSPVPDPASIRRRDPG